MFSDFPVSLINIPDCMVSGRGCSDKIMGKKSCLDKIMPNNGVYSYPSSLFPLCKGDLRTFHVVKKPQRREMTAAESTVLWGFTLAERSPAEPLSGAALKLLCINKEVSKSLTKTRRWEVQNWLTSDSVLTLPPTMRLTQCFPPIAQRFPLLFCNVLW